MMISLIFAAALTVAPPQTPEERAAFERSVRFSFRKSAVEFCLTKISQKSSGLFDAVSVCTCSADQLLERPIAELLKNDFADEDIKRITAQCLNADPSITALKRR